MLFLDIFTRAILIPGAAIYILYLFIPEAVKDVKEWSKLFVSEKKTARTRTVAPATNSDSPLVSQAQILYQ